MKSDIEILAEVTDLTVNYLEGAENDYSITLLETLTALATLRSQMQGSKWIDESEKEPEDGVAVIVHLDSGVITIAYKCKDKFEGTQVVISWQLFGDINRMVDLKGGKITHWQPIPEPPAPLTKY